METLLRILDKKKARTLLLSIILCITTVCTVYLFTSVSFSSLGPCYIISALILPAEIIALIIFLHMLNETVLSFKLREASYRQMIASLSKEASTDTLTQLYNRMFIETCLEFHIDNSFLLSQALSIILLDIDHFKEINDTYGHQAGDMVLTQFSNLLLKCVRKSDYAGRLGGDEFIIVLPSTDLATAVLIAERATTILNTSILFIGTEQSVKISCSMGISNYPLHCNTREELIKAADYAMYHAKTSGRNCYKVYKS